MKSRNLYPAPAFVDIGDLQDNDPPVFEPVDEYLIPDAYINSNGYIYKKFKPLKETISFRHRDSVKWKNVLNTYLFKKKIKINRPAISILSGWNDNFYHFTLESLPKLYVLREHIGKSAIVFPKNLKVFHKEWIKLLNLEDIIYIGDDEVVETPLAVSATFTSRDLNHHNTIIPEFSGWVLEKIEKIKCPEHKKIFIGRKNPRHRKLLNLDEVKRFLEKKGFVYLEMEDYDLPNQIKIFNNADQIICLHGAALTHLCFTQHNTRVVDVIHEDFYQWCFLKLSKILNINYVQLRCPGEKGSKKLPGYRDLEIDLNALSSIL